ncbi:MAG: sodium/glutamate symporter, partial [Shewanella sp.]
LVILLVQTAVLAVFAYFVTFKIMGSNYDAAVITGGHCGFGMGATPTAVMNMGALVSRTGPSPQAFMVVPIVGAFFIDIVNMIVLQGYLSFIM